jgi:hypothetical protein
MPAQLSGHELPAEPVVPAMPAQLSGHELPAEPKTPALPAELAGPIIPTSAEAPLVLDLPAGSVLAAVGQEPVVALHLPQQPVEILSPPVNPSEPVAPSFPVTIPIGKQNAAAVPSPGKTEVAAAAAQKDSSVPVSTTPNRPTGYDLPPDQLQKVLAASANAPAVISGKKIDYCAENIDPYAHQPVDTFVPPAGADFELVSQWKSAVRAMISKISKVKFGGEELRELIRGEVEALSVLRFKMFCKYGNMQTAAS